MGRFVSIETKSSISKQQTDGNQAAPEKRVGRFVKVGDTSKIGANENAVFRTVPDVSGEAWTRSTPSQYRLPSGYISSQERELSRLSKLRQEAAVNLDADTMNESYPCAGW